MKKIFLAAIISNLLLSSCIQSLYPLTENKNQMVFKEELLGVWKEADGGTEYFVDSAGDKGYRVTIVENDKNHISGSLDTSYLLMTLVSVKGKYFLDCSPDVNQPFFYGAEEQTANLIVPAHYIFRVNSISANALEIGSIDGDEVSKLVQQKKFSINYEAIQKDLALLVHKPQILQQKFTELEKFPSAYEKTILKKQ
jgi:hypothetical protein